MRVLVVGAGIMGLSTAWGLVRRGVQVTVVDQDPIPNPRSASFDSHRLIRYPYGAHTGYGRRIDEAYAAWDLLWADLADRPYVETGTLVVGDPRSPWIEASLVDMRRSSRPMRAVDGDELSMLAPGFVTRAGEGAWHHPSGGVLLADRIVSGLVHWLRLAGAELVPDCKVTGLDPDRGVVHTPSRSLEADVVVVASGAWSIPGLEDASVVPSRQVLRYLDRAHDPVWRTRPMLLALGSRHGFYLVPPVSGTAMKIGDHRFSRVGHPDDARQAEAHELRSLDRMIRDRLPMLEPSSGRSYVCYYAVTPDERFRASHMGRTWTLRGFSGHGFKFGAWVGLNAASMITGDLQAAAFTNRMAGF